MLCLRCQAPQMSDPDVGLTSSYGLINKTLVFWIICAEHGTNLGGENPLSARRGG